MNTLYLSVLSVKKHFNLTLGKKNRGRISHNALSKESNGICLTDLCLDVVCVNIRPSLIF